MSDPGEMHAFVRVVEEGGFSAAARKLGLTPSAVSKQVTRLEERLNARLLNRTTRRLSLTDAGEAYFDRARRILAEIDEAETSVSQMGAEPRGRLRITASVAFGHLRILPLLPEFLARYPEIRIDFNLTDGLLDIVESGIDIAIRFAAPEDSSLVARKLAEERRILCAAPIYLARHGVPETPEDLAHHNCLIYSTVYGGDWRFTGPGGERTVRVTSNFDANSGEAVRDMALAGLGVVRVASFVVERELNEGRLVHVLSDYREPRGSAIYVVYPHRRQLSPKVRAFVDYLTDRMASPSSPLRDV